MFIDFNQLPETARVWVYQSNRTLTAAEQNSILENAKTFLVSWTAHNQALKASCQVFYHQFLVLAVDESHTEASGCSIDKSVHFVQSLENQYNTRFFDRTLQAFLVNNEVKMIPLNELKNAVSNGQLTFETIAFNNLVSTIAQLKAEWLQPAGKTWLARYFKEKVVSA